MEKARWNELKNERLKRTRGVSFDEITKAKLLDIVANPAHPEQHFMLFEHKDYVWVVPCIRDAEGLFLKTLYRSRKYNKRYHRGQET